MKRIFNISILAACALSLLSACATKEKLVAVDNTIAVVSSKLGIPAKGGEAYIELEKDETVSVTVDRDWCKAAVEGKTVKFTAEANEDLQPRYAKVVLTAGEKTLKATIQQFGYLSVSFDVSDVTVPASPAKGGYDFPYNYNEMMVATTDQSEWIHITVTEDNLHIEVDTNKVAGAPDNRSREGKVEWKLGIESGTITFVQRNASYLSICDNWTVKYEGVLEIDGEEAAVLTNTVANPALSGKWALTYVAKADVDKSGYELSDYIDLVLADEYKEEVDAYIAILSAFGMDVTYDDFLYEDSDSAFFDPLKTGNYYGVAIGYTSDMIPSGPYQYVEFKAINSGDRPETGYKSWIGEWTVKRGSTTDTWKITKDVDGSSYKIAGIEGDPCQVGPLTAYYDAAKDALVVKAAPNLKTVNTQYGEAVVGLYGQIQHTSGPAIVTLGDPTKPYTICTATHTDYEHATMTPGKVTLSSGGDYDFCAVCFAGEVAEGILTFSQDKTALPNTMEAIGGTGGGGDDPSGEGSEAYNKWLGTWKDAAGGIYTVSQKVADKTFNIAGFGAELGYVVESYFDAATGGMKLCGQELGSDSSYEYYFGGEDSDDYIVDGESANNYLLATGKVASDGKTAVFTGNKFREEYGGEMYDEEIVSVLIYGYDGGETVQVHQPVLNMGENITKNGSAARVGRIAGKVFTKVDGTPQRHGELRRPDLRCYTATAVKAK